MYSYRVTPYFGDHSKTKQIPKFQFFLRSNQSGGPKRVWCMYLKMAVKAKVF